DGFWERGLKTWDIAAGILLVRESGGLVESLDLKNPLLIKGDIIASNGEIFEQFSNFIRPT
ncbi:MAG: inositol monophosphatase, partial [Proteobacteria bacterium]|nr:inositol monophosphatase [Pseudomonadota bacterium]